MTQSIKDMDKKTVAILVEAMTEDVELYYLEAIVKKHIKRREEKTPFTNEEDYRSESW